MTGAGGTTGGDAAQRLIVTCDRCLVRYEIVGEKP
jgi:hypothetical protein